MSEPTTMEQRQRARKRVLERAQRAHWQVFKDHVERLNKSAIADGWLTSPQVSMLYTALDPLLHLSLQYEELCKLE